MQGFENSSSPCHVVVITSPASIRRRCGRFSLGASKETRQNLYQCDQQYAPADPVMEIYIAKPIVYAEHQCERCKRYGERK